MGGNGIIATLYREPIAKEPAKEPVNTPGPYGYGEANASVQRDIDTAQDQVVEDNFTPTLVLGAGAILGYYMAGSLANTLSLKLGGAIAGFLAGKYVNDNILN